jgi:DNA-binding SARP family transcriptional activator
LVSSLIEADGGGRPSAWTSGTEATSQDGGGPSISKTLSATAIRLELLGGFELAVNGCSVWLPSSVQRLIAFLALQPHPLRRAHVAGRLWPDVSEARSSANLRSALWRLRRTGLDFIHGTPSHLALAEYVSIDTDEVVASSRRLLDNSAVCTDDDLNPGRLIGELLPDWYVEEWVAVERERLRQLCLHALEASCGRLAALGRYGEAIEAGLWAVRGDPLRESAHRQLIKVHLAEGNRAEAIRSYHWYHSLLQDELGLTPSNTMTALVRELLHEGTERADDSTTIR